MQALKREERQVNGTQTITTGLGSQNYFIHRLSLSQKGRREREPGNEWLWCLPIQTFLVHWSYGSANYSYSGMAVHPMVGVDS